MLHRIGSKQRVPDHPVTNAGPAIQSQHAKSYITVWRGVLHEGRQVRPESDDSCYPWK